MKSLQALIAESTGHVRTLNSACAKDEYRENSGYLIDIRENAEVKAKPVTASHHIARGVLEMKIGELCSDANAPIYLHCASGGRARLAAAQLLLMGYQDVTAISDDIDTVCEAFNDGK